MTICSVCGTEIKYDHLHGINAIEWFSIEKPKFEQICFTSFLESEAELTLDQINTLKIRLNAEFGKIRRSWQSFAYDDKTINMMWSVYQYTKEYNV